MLPPRRTRWPRTRWRRGRVQYDGRRKAGARRYEWDELSQFEHEFSGIDWLYCNLVGRDREGELGRLAVARREVAPPGGRRERDRLALLERCEVSREEFGRWLRLRGLSLLVDPRGFPHIVFSHRTRRFFAEDERDGRA